MKSLAFAQSSRVFRKLILVTLGSMAIYERLSTLQTKINQSGAISLVLYQQEISFKLQTKFAHLKR